jgi:hypothetical protein
MLSLRKSTERQEARNSRSLVAALCRDDNVKMKANSKAGNGEGACGSKVQESNSVRYVAAKAATYNERQQIYRENNASRRSFGSEVIIDLAASRNSRNI